jgi:hypothetical protein
MMKKIKKDNKLLLPRMNPMEERGQSNDLYAEAIPVWYSRSGKVNPEWLSACREQRNLTKGLMEQIADPLNLGKAYQRVLSNGGSGGVDEMAVKELQGWLGEHLNQLQHQLLQGIYEPQPIRGVEIRKPNGGKRQLGIPTVIDRLIQQALHQVLSVDYERIFSRRSYGFRADKNAHQALKQAGSYVAEGKSYVIDLDLEKFFDEVNHHRLLWLLSTRIGDKRVLQLIHRYLKAGMLQEGLTGQRIKGTPQGSPLALRTHPQTLSFLGDFRLKGVNFKFDCFIKGSIFMINGKITEFGTGQAHQPGVCFTTERKASFSDSRTFNGDVWSITNPGVSLCSASQREQREDGCSGNFCGIHRQTTTRTDQSNKEICELQRNIDQQSGPYCAGRIFSKEGSWQKRRNNLRCHIPMTAYGSKSSRRFIVSLSQSTLLTQLNKIPLLN